MKEINFRFSSPEEALRYLKIFKELGVPLHPLAESSVNTGASTLTSHLFVDSRGVGTGNGMHPNSGKLSEFLSAVMSLVPCPARNYSTKIGGYTPMIQDGILSIGCLTLNKNEVAELLTPVVGDVVIDLAARKVHVRGAVVKLDEAIELLKWARNNM